MTELIKKLANAKAEIKNSPLKKEGRNDFSKYDYFTPSQIEMLVANACHNNGLITLFDLIRNELGVYGQLSIYDTETGEKITTQMATAIPEIKATNIAQQLGGCVTYTERYLKMSVFGITDNKLDFDTTENTKKQEADKAKAEAAEKLLNTAPQQAYDEISKCTTLEELQKVALKYRLYATDPKFAQAGNDKKAEIKTNLNL